MIIFVDEFFLIIDCLHDLTVSSFKWIFILVYLVLYVYVFV